MSPERRLARAKQVGFSLAGLIAAVSAASAGCEYFGSEARDAIRKLYPNCAAPVRCGSLYYVDCGVAVDRASHYFDSEGVEISTCGGACWKTRDPKQIEMCQTQCPPPAWTCGQK